MGLPSRADEKDFSKGLTEIMNIVKHEQLKRRKPKTSKKSKKPKKIEDFFDIDEFNDLEEENYLQNELEQKKLEDENLEVYLIEA